MISDYRLVIYYSFEWPFSLRYLQILLISFERKIARFMPTLRQYLQTYNSSVKKQDPKLTIEQSALKQLQTKIDLIKSKLPSKTPHREIDEHLEEIKELFILSFNRLANDNKSQVNVQSARSRLTRRKLRTQRMLIGKENKENLGDSQISMSFESKNQIGDEAKLAFTKSTEISFVKKKRYSDQQGLKSKKERKIFFAEPPELDQKICDSIDSEQELRITNRRRDTACFQTF